MPAPHQDRHQRLVLVLVRSVCWLADHHHLAAVLVPVAHEAHFGRALQTGAGATLAVVEGAVLTNTLAALSGSRPIWIRKLMALAQVLEIVDCTTMGLQLGHAIHRNHVNLVRATFQ